MTTVAAPLAPARSVGTTARGLGPEVLHGTLLALLIAAPLPLACAPAAPRAALGAILAALVAALAVLAVQRRAMLAVPPGSGALLLLCCVPLLQLAPLGASAPGESARWLLGDHLSDRLATAPVRVAPRLLEWAGHAACYLAAASLLVRGARARLFATALVALAAAQAFHGVLQQHGIVPLLDERQTRTVLVGTYVNRNHLAGLFELAVLVGTGLFAAQRIRRAPAAAQLLLGAALLAALLGLVATGSRAGLLSLGCGLAIFAALATRARPRRLAIAAIVLATAASVTALLLPDGLIERFARVDDDLHTAGMRPDIWRGALALWAAFPWFGIGLGAYGDLSPATQPAAVPGRLEHAHCDPLELLVETGLVGTGFALAFVVAFAVPLVRRCLRTSDRERAMLAAGGLAALGAIGVHGLVDFNLQIPANAAWTAAIAGLVAAQLRGRDAPVASPRTARCVAMVGVLAAGFGLLRATTHDQSDGLSAIDRGRAVLASEPRTALRLAEEAVGKNPFSPRAHRLRGDALLALREPGSATAFAASLRWTNPADRPRHQLEVAVACLRGGDAEQAEHWLCDLLPRHPDRLPDLLGALWTAVPAGEALLPLLPEHPRAVREAFAELLVRRGDFAGCERTLAALRGDAEPALLTLARGVRLIGRRIEIATRRDATAADVVLRFARDAGAPAVPVALRCEGPGAASFRPFDVRDERHSWRFVLDGTWPPGLYTISLGFRGGVPPLPLGAFEVAASPLSLDATVAAERLYWTTAEPAQRTRPARGVPLRQGDLLWRDVELPADATTLVVHCAGPARLAAKLGDRPLTPVHDRALTVLRFVLPEERTGTLALAARADDDVPVVLELFTTGGGVR